MTAIRTAQVAEPGGPFKIVPGEPSEADRGRVRLTVEAVGVCHSDAYFVNGAYPDEWPAVFGHEIAGCIEAVGADVNGWRVGERVAVGWFGGHCGGCNACREATSSTARRSRFPTASTQADTPTRSSYPRTHWPASPTA